MQQTEGFGALHGGHRVFPDGHLAGVDEAVLLEGAHQVAAEVFQADIAVALLAGRQLHAVEADAVAGLEHPRQFGHQVIEMLEELRVGAAVAHVARAVAVGVQAGERRREDRVVHTALGQAGDHLHAIAVEQGIVGAVDLMDALHAASLLSHAGAFTRRAAV
ncbi:hypothetical protein D9M73_204080 [compost metagenome]